MNQTLQVIPLLNLAIIFIPVLIVLAVLFVWSLKAVNVAYALARMLVQLMIVGYFLAYLFASDSALLIVLVLSAMVCISSWIALRTIETKRRLLYKNALIAIAVGGGVSLLLVTQGVLTLDKWYAPQYVIPIAGMVFSAAMNSVSLAAERVFSEREKGVSYEDARKAAFQASLIPIVNMMFAVGLVSLPGMMTGQILSGVSPLIAARYQIMVMCMMFGAAGIASAVFLVLIKSGFRDTK